MALDNERNVQDVNIVSGTISVGNVGINAGSNSIGSVNLGTTDSTNLATVSGAQGTDGTGITQPTGGAGIRGWLSGIYNALIGALTIKDAYLAPNTTNWTSATTVGTTIAVSSLQAYDGVGITISIPATITAGQGVFEVYDGINWVSVKGGRLEAYTGDVLINFATYAGIVKSWTFSTAPYAQFRIRLTVAIVGTGNVAIQTMASSAPIDPAITVGIDTSTLGQQVSASSLSTVIASDQSTIPVKVIGVATGGATKFRIVSAATTNATSTKATAGVLKMLSLGNVNAAARFLKVYDKASAPTVGTDVPVWTIMIPANPTAALGAGREIPFPPEGIAFSNGIAFAITANYADSDTTAVAAGDVTLAGAYL